MGLHSIHMTFGDKMHFSLMIIISFKFLGVHITDKLKWSTHTDSVVKKAPTAPPQPQEAEKNVLAPTTLTNFYRCTIESILSGCITAWYGNRAARNQGLPRGWCGLPKASNYLPSRTPTAPDVTGRPKGSSRTTTTRATACSPRYHPEGEVSTGA